MSKHRLSRQAVLQALEQLEPATLSAHGFDAQKVEHLRQAIRDGSYQIDAAAVADGLIGAVLAKLATRPGPAIE